MIEMTGNKMNTKNGTMGRAGLAAMSLTCLLLLLGTAGCKNFFSPINSTSTGTTVVNTGDYAYVVNDVASTIYGFSVGSGTLTALSGFPLTLTYLPITAVVTPSNGFLYVAGEGFLYGYTISSSGELTEVGTGALAQANIVSMVVSPDNQWLIALDSSTAEAVIDYYLINSDGTLTAQTSYAYALQKSTATIVPNSIRIDPAGSYVAAALGTGGDVLYSFNTSNGTFAAQVQVNTGSTSGADQALAFDSTGSTLYVARSGTGGGVYPYTIGISGSSNTLTLAAGAPFGLGNGPASMVIDATGKYLYVGNKADSTISGFTIGTGGVLAPLAGSPYATGSSVAALAKDSSGDYIFSANSGGTPDVDLYSFDTTTGGKLDVAKTVDTGDTAEPAGAIAIALTHSTTSTQ